MSGSATAVGAAAGAKLGKLLCLHGYTQNGPVFRRRTAVLRKDIAKLYECHHVSAPHKVAPQHVRPLVNKDQAQDDQLAWWLYDEATKEYTGLEASLAHLEHEWATHGPFDGILGFSQGATMAWILAGHLNRTQRLNPQVFVVAVSGFLPGEGLARDSVKAAAAASVHGLHVVGDADEWVLPERSLALIDALRTVHATAESAGSPASSVEHTHPQEDLQTLVRHDGGHFVPTDAKMRQTMREWLTARRSMRSML
ncbi:serine hydrolase FSH, partial [Entophlyctis helioformis]